MIRMKPGSGIGKIFDRRTNALQEFFQIPLPSHQGLLATISGFFFLPTLTFAQLPTVELRSVDPPIVKAGTTAVVSVSGANTDELSELHFSNPKITAKRVFLPKNEFRLHPVPDGNKFEVTVPADVPAAPVEVRALGYFGFSNTRPLVIAASDSNILSDSAKAAHHKLETAPELPREAIAHGLCDPNQTDWWKISVKKGERLLVHCHAERIDSVADASLKLVDGRGYELETNRDFVGRDPMLDFTAPADGNYWVGVHDALYNGSNLHPYLLQVSTKPWIDAVFPPAAQKGAVMEATLIGRNLPGGSAGEGLEIDGKPLETLAVKVPVPEKQSAPAFEWDEPSRASLAGFPFQHAGSIEVKIGISNNPVTPVRNDANLPPITPPLEIAATFEKDGDSDAFRILTKKGTTYWVEVVADRIAGKIDPYLVVEKVTKVEGGTETFATVRESDDDNGVGGATFRNGTRDTSLSFASDQDGEYRITVVNHFAKGGPDKTYRLAIREAQPDFEVIAVTERPYLDARQAYPATPYLTQGSTFPIRILTKRIDGFDDPITVTAKGLPAGIVAPPVTLSAKESSTRIVFAANEDAAPWAGQISLEASGNIAGKPSKKIIRSGTLHMGVADYNIARLRSRLELDTKLVNTERKTKPAVRIEAGNDREFSVTMGEKLEIPIQVLTDHQRKGNLAVTAVGLRGLTRAPSINIAEKAKEGKMTLNFVKQNNVFNPEPGTWTFVLKGTGVVTYQRNPEAAARATEEQKHIENLAKKYTEAATAAKADLEAKKKTYELAQKNLTAASADAKSQLEQAATTAKAAFDQAQQKSTEAEAKRAQGEKEKTAAIARAKAATTAAAAKDTKFATWSLPITVEVKPAPEKK